MAPINNAVFATLLMNDGYLPGAMVLGHSLKDKGAKGKLVVLVVLDQVSASTITELKTVYDDVVSVQQIKNNAPANLYLMNRPDLISAFTKIQLWKQTQYKRIVYIDADVVAISAPNELLTMDTEFAAVPDIGWPDCFNSGVMVLNPNMADYYALLALAERGISFDGADQGLLNMHFTEWEHLGFKYNCTPSGNYQYAPAYRHFQSSITLIHFIGRDKPWTMGRSTTYTSGIYGELLGRWWAVYDKHYRARETVYYDGQWQQAPKKVQDYVAGEETMYMPASQAPPPVPHTTSTEQTPSSGHASVVASEQPMGDQPTVEEQITNKEFEPTSTVEQRRWSAPHAEWEPSRAPPPINSKPEASNFPTQIYDFSEDVKLFQPPVAYPDAPKDMWYEVPAKPEPQPQPKPIFPWELNARKPTRVFYEAKLPSPPVQSPAHEYANTIRTEPQFIAEDRSQVGVQLGSTSQSGSQAQSDTQAQSYHSAQSSSQALSNHRTEANSQNRSDTEAQLSHSSRSPQSEVTPSAAADREATTTTNAESSHPPTWTGAPWVDPWETFNQRTNAWDDVPEITRYVQSLQPPKRGAIQVLHHTPSAGGRRDSLLVTDFPTETERPSLPVTPAPIRRPTFWGEEKDMSGELPNAEGVPKQDEWVRRFSSYPTPAFADVSPLVHESEGILCVKCQFCGKQNPIAKLEELQRRQSDALLGKTLASTNPPKRDLPESASLEQVEAAVEKATSPVSSRPLKPILKEPHFELSMFPDHDHGSESSGTHHDSTDDVLSPSDTGGSASDVTPTSTPRIRI